jgi:hypothetical protein
MTKPIALHSSDPPQANKALAKIIDALDAGSGHPRPGGVE